MKKNLPRKKWDLVQQRTKEFNFPIMFYEYFIFKFQIKRKDYEIINKLEELF